VSEDHEQEPLTERYLERRIESKGLRPRVAATLIAVLWLIAIVLFGLLVFLVDRSTFHDVWEGMWWATQTVTTVGYGDVVPASTAGRFVGSILMIGGLSLFAVVTGTITSSFVTRAQRHQSTTDPATAERLDEIAAELRELRAEVSALRRSAEGRRGDDA
jgi:voltage-gated potassium channel Kch